MEDDAMGCDERPLLGRLRGLWIPLTLALVPACKNDNVFRLPESLKQIQVPGEGCDRLGEDDWTLTRSPEFAKATTIGRNEFATRCHGIEKYFVTQSSADTCWAACAAIVLSYEGAPSTEQSLIDAMRGHTTGETANDDQIMRALNLDLEPQVRARFSRVSTAPPMTNTAFIKAILGGHPVIFGLKAQKDDDEGHACVAFAVGFRKLHNNAAIEALDADEWGVAVVQVWDPYPGAGEYTIPCAELNGKLEFAVTRESARQAILKSIEPPNTDKVEGLLRKVLKRGKK